jgi:hypothetical protein
MDPFAIFAVRFRTGKLIFTSTLGGRIFPVFIDGIDNADVVDVVDLEGEKHEAGIGVDGWQKCSDIVTKYY